MPWDSENCCSWEFWLPVFVWVIHLLSRIWIVLVSLSCRLWKYAGGRSTYDSTFSGQVRVNVQTDSRFSKCLEQFIWEVRWRLCCKESCFVFDSTELLQRGGNTITIVVVPSATRLGIDVDHAIEQIESNHAWNAGSMPTAVLVLHNQAPHLPDVRPSRHQLTDDKYAKLAAILDLQIYGGRMRNCPLNNTMARELANVLLKQHTAVSGSRYVEEEEHSLMHHDVMEI